MNNNNNHINHINSNGYSLIRCNGHYLSSLASLSGEKRDDRESMEYDVIIVGGGPAGLSTAIKLKQISIEADKELSVCILEKGSEIGAHILSGNVFIPKYLNELIPDWKEKGAPLDTPVTKDHMHFFTETMSVPLLVPPQLNNHGNYVISLGSLCRWLATEAEELGVEIYPGFAASDILIDEDSKTIRGVATRDMGIDKSGEKRDVFEPGIELHAKQTILAEGARGSLSEQIIEYYNLRQDSSPQHYGIGLKEVWEIPEEKCQPGLVQHTVGWPLPTDTYGGTFLYHMKPNLVLLGMVVGLDYKDPYLNPYEEFQRWKHHPKIKATLEGGTCISYGARALNEGGYYSIPKLTFPGGLLIGCSAGFLDVARIKGSHNAMKSGMVAAEAIAQELLNNENPSNEMVDYERRLQEDTPIYDELYQSRNVHGVFSKYGLYVGLLRNAFDLFFRKGKRSASRKDFVPSNFDILEDNADSTKTHKKDNYKPREYPKHDGKISFDLLTNLQRSGTYHDDNQPSHLRIKPEKANVPKEISYQEFAAPETRFCPANVYEYVIEDGKEPELVINAQNCLHCKTCSIKMPKEYIEWTVPEGAGGPNYQNM